MSAVRDNNSIPVFIGLSDSDGSTILNLQVDPTSHGIIIDDNTTGSDLTGDNAPRDNNSVPTVLATSSSDGITPVPVYIKSATGGLLINSI
jgi:hypothetical protein